MGADSPAGAHKDSVSKISVFVAQLLRRIGACRLLMQVAPKNWRIGAQELAFTHAGVVLVPAVYSIIEYDLIELRLMVSGRRAFWEVVATSTNRAKGR